MTGTLWQSSQSFYFLFSMQVYIIQSAICKIPYNLILVKKFFIWILFWSLKRKGWYVMIMCFPKSTSKWFFGGFFSTMIATSMYSKCIYQDPFVYWLDSKDSVISTIILFAIVYYEELYFLYFKRALVFNSQDLECEFWIIITGYSTLCFQILVKHSTSRIK